MYVYAIHVKRDLFMGKETHTDGKRNACTWKETKIYGTGDSNREKRPICFGKETHIIWEKSPICFGKDTHTPPSFRTLCARWGGFG